MPYCGHSPGPFLPTRPALSCLYYTFSLGSSLYASKVSTPSHLAFCLFQELWRISRALWLDSIPIVSLMARGYPSRTWHPSQGGAPGPSSTCHGCRRVIPIDTLAYRLLFKHLDLAATMPATTPSASSLAMVLCQHSRRRKCSL